MYTKFLYSSKRPIWLVASIINMTDTQRTTIFNIASKSSKPVVLMDKCSRSVVKRSKHGVRCAYGTAQTHYYPMTFGQSQFCLIAKTERIFQLNFIEALATNCIPVVFADNIVLPFTEVCTQFSRLANFYFFSRWNRLILIFFWDYYFSVDN